MPQTVLITGASIRIGRSIALSFGDKGWNVAVHYHQSEQEALILVQALQEKGVKAAAFQGDLQEEEDYRSLFSRVEESLGTVHCLVNNASTFDYDTPITATRESWDYHMETNLRAPFVLSQQFVAQLPSQISGNIINILDQRVWNLTPYYTTYTLSKVGLWTLTQTLSLALAPYIRVNGIGLGPTLPSKSQTIDCFEKQCAQLPLQKGPLLEEVSRTIEFILSTPSLTGQMIALDGGQHMAWSFPNTIVSVYD